MCWVYCPMTILWKLLILNFNEITTFYYFSNFYTSFLHGNVFIFIKEKYMRQLNRINISVSMASLPLVSILTLRQTYSSLIISLEWMIWECCTADVDKLLIFFFKSWFYEYIYKVINDENNKYTNIESRMSGWGRASVRNVQPIKQWQMSKMCCYMFSARLSASFDNHPGCRIIIFIVI